MLVLVGKSVLVLMCCRCLVMLGRCVYFVFLSFFEVMFLLCSVASVGEAAYGVRVLQVCWEAC